MFKVLLLIACVLGLTSGQGQRVPQCELSKDVMVQFHGWKYTDIERECEASSSRYYCAFQVPPPYEHQLVEQSFPSGSDPWWQRYMAVGFSLTRSDGGSQLELQSMLQTCNNNNIRIYIDFQMNNAGGSTDSGDSTAGNYYDASTYQYPHFSGQSFYHLKETPVPDGCPTSSGLIEDVANVSQVHYCKRRVIPIDSITSPVRDLLDIKTGLTQVRTDFRSAMNTLLNGIGNDQRGVAGFRIQHARWMPPADVADVVNNIENIKIPVVGNNVRPLIYSEVFPDDIISETDYTGFGLVEESRAGPLLSSIIRKTHPTYRLANLTLWGPAMGLMASADAVVFIDDPGSQRGWPEIQDVDKTLKYDDSRNYQTANAFMLAHPYGYPRVHSSYDWDRVLVDDNGVDKDINDWQGPPRDADGNIIDVVPSANTFSCNSAWNCEHRWLAIRGLARFRNLMKQFGADNVQNYWTNGYHQMAFSRASSGFIAMNNEGAQDLVASIYTGMTAGVYCDLATGIDPTASPCEGRTIIVDSGGRAAVNLPANDPVPFIAIAQI